MLDNILKFFEQRFIETSSTFHNYNDHDLQIASIALLIEMMYIDDNIADAERTTLIKIVCEKYDLPPNQAEEIMASAEAQLEQTTDYFQYTRMINKCFEPDQKIKLVEYLWQVAFADGRLDAKEEYLVRKVADLLHVPHRDFIRTKIRVKGE